MPPVSPDVSESYRWTECGRIEPAMSQPIRPLYAADESILFTDGFGRIYRYPVDERSPQVLAQASPTAKSSSNTGLTLSSSGERLLRWHDAEIDIYVAESGETIGADSGRLMLLTHIERSGTECDGETPASLSFDAEQIVGSGATNVCIWETESGALSTTIPLPAVAGARVLAGIGAGTAPVRVLHDRTLRTYTLAGEPADSFDLRTLLPDGSLPNIALSPDASTLLATVPVGAPPDAWDLIAIDTQSGAQRWRRATGLAGNPPSMTFSNDGYVLLDGAHVYRVDDGEIVRDDQLTFPWWSAALAPEGRKKLLMGEFMTEWDLVAGKASTLYGAHTSKVYAIDVSRDGRYFASHGRWAVLWELDSDFVSSRPLSQGAGSDVSWNVAIAPDGSGFAVSGDNVSFFRRDGSFQLGDPPSPTAIDCLSPDWSFSPDGALVAGGHYGTFVEIRSARDFQITRGLSAVNCGGGVAFSPDSKRLVTASLELFETETWTKIWSHPSNEKPGLGSENAVEFSPDGRELVVTRCKEVVENCSSERYGADDGLSRGELPDLSNDRARYSPEGHWLVSGGRVLHVPSGTSLGYADDATAAAFTPDGDIIAGTSDGSLLRFCRGRE